MKNSLLYRTSLKLDLIVSSRKSLLQKVTITYIVIANLEKIHHDGRLWTNPEKFDPERFYDQKNNAYKGSPNLIPFSVGKRYCPGQSLAEKELFLFFVGMLKKFHFKLSGDVSLREDDGKKDWLAFNLPPKFQVLLERR